MSKLTIHQLPTPSLLLRQHVFEQNIKRMYEKCAKLGVSIRPHLKTAKSADILKSMQARPMKGITVSTLHEAEYFAASGVSDILYAVTIAPNKIARALTLSETCPELCLLIDNLRVCMELDIAASKLDHKLKVMIEIDVDGHRAGLLPDDEALIKLARFITSSKNLQLQGLMTHAGESYLCDTPESLTYHAQREVALMIDAKTRLHAHDIACPNLSIGSTPTANAYTDLNGIDEVRAGVFVFYDLVMANIGVCCISDIAIGVLTTIISHKKSHKRIIIDAGGLALSKDRGTASQKRDYGYGLVLNAETWEPIDELIVNSANQEHGIVNLASSKQFDTLEIGKKLIILPNHACMTAAAYDKYWVIDNKEEIKTMTRINGW